MLFFTNRTIDPAQPGASAFRKSFPVMGQHLGYAGVSDGGSGWQLSGITAEGGDDDIVQALVAVFGGGKPVLVYIHGNNNPPATAFGRGARLEELYGVAVIGFSWPSEGFQPDGNDLSGLDPSAPDAETDEETLSHVRWNNIQEGPITRKIRRYRQAKANAQDSTLALARFLRLVSVARQYANRQPLTLAAHSLGCHYLQKSLQIDGVYSSLAAAQNVVLLAPCVRSAQHRTWVERISPVGGVYVTYNQPDSVLAAATVADSGETKLGIDPGQDLVRTGKVRYVCFTGTNSGLGGHRYFVADHPKRPPKAHFDLFAAIFGSRPDLSPGANPKTVYPFGCDADRTACFMGNDTLVTP